MLKVCDLLLDFTGDHNQEITLTLRRDVGFLNRARLQKTVETFEVGLNLFHIMICPQAIEVREWIVVV